MGTFKLITASSMRNWNKTEKTEFLANFMSFLPVPQETDPDDGGSPGTISLLSIEEEGVPALNITAEQVKRMNEIIASLTSITDEAKSYAETPDMQQTEAKRDRVANYIVRRIVNYDLLPSDEEVNAAKAMEPFFRSYYHVAELPNEQETRKLYGMLEDLAKPEYAEHITTLGLTKSIADLQALNDHYSDLKHQRQEARAERTDMVNATELLDEAQDLLDDMCALANASSLLQPSEEATKFIRNVNSIFTEARAAYKARTKGEDEEQPGTETPGTEPPGEGTGEEETPNPDGQQPTEPQPGVDTDGDGSPEVV